MDPKKLLRYLQSIVDSKKLSSRCLDAQIQAISESIDILRKSSAKLILERMACIHPGVMHPTGRRRRPGTPPRFHCPCCGIHDFYVLCGDEPVLVIECMECGRMLELQFKK